MLIDNWRQEILLLKRFAGIGTINSAVGFICIFSAMALGFSPISSNVIGYGFGFLLGFVFSKKFVFHSNGNLVIESIRYLFFLFFASFVIF